MSDGHVALIFLHSETHTIHCHQYTLTNKHTRTCKEKFLFLCFLSAAGSSPLRVSKCNTITIHYNLSLFLSFLCFCKIIMSLPALSITTPSILNSPPVFLVTLKRKELKRKKKTNPENIHSLTMTEQTCGCLNTDS